MQQAKGLSHKKMITFLELAFTISRLSKDKNTQVGAVIVSPCLTQFSMGYNGPPRGIEDTEERLTRPLKYDYMIHAEENAIINARRSLVDNYLFVTLFPCSKCALKIINSEIKEVYCPVPTSESHLQHSMESLKLFQEAGVKVFVLNRTASVQCNSQILTKEIMFSDYVSIEVEYYNKGFNDGVDEESTQFSEKYR